MTKHSDDLFTSHLNGGLSRRDLINRAARLGLTGAAAGILVNRAATMALAADFDWKKYSGQPIRLLLNKHPYTDAVIANLENFKQLTGIAVTYDVLPEDVYFDRLTASLQSGSSQYDVFMTGAYQTWHYGPAGWIVDLNEFIHDQAATAPTYNWTDILPNLRSALSWSGVIGEPLGGPGAKQFALPLGFELNSLTYNAAILKQMGISPPTSLPDLLEKAAHISASGKDIYGVGTRGSRSWASIHPGYLSAFANYGGQDFIVKNGKLTAAMNSPQGKAMTRLWVEMIQKGGPKNWHDYTWYEVSGDLASGASAMIYDADILGYFSNRSGKEAGNLAFDGFVPNPDAKSATPNIWTWALAMSSHSKQKQAAWYFMQWASAAETTTLGATKADLVNPVRRSVWENAAFVSKMDSKVPGYLAQYKQIVGAANIYFTPQPQFFDLTTLWASSLQKMVAGTLPVDEGLDQLASALDDQTSG